MFLLMMLLFAAVHVQPIAARSSLIVQSATIESDAGSGAHEMAASHER
jgi:hypothetical protein